MASHSSELSAEKHIGADLATVEEHQDLTDQQRLANLREGTVNDQRQLEDAIHAYILYLFKAMLSISFFFMALLRGYLAENTF